MVADRQFSQSMAQKFSFSDLQKLIKIVERQRGRAVSHDKSIKMAL